jgi:hypothetical protein
MDDLPFDFTRYLSQRLGVSSEQATDLLRSWLKDYEPVSCRPGGTRTRPRSEGAEVETWQQLG